MRTWPGCFALLVAACAHALCHAARPEPDTVLPDCCRLLAKALCTAAGCGLQAVSPALAVPVCTPATWPKVYPTCCASSACRKAFHPHNCCELLKVLAVPDS